MKVLPDMKTVQDIAATGRYDILPVSCEILSDICTPIEALKILKNVSTHCYLLESVAEKEKWGRRIKWQNCGNFEVTYDKNKIMRT